jgi:hypothetical protein
VTLLISVVLLFLALVLQAALGRLWPSAHVWVDLFLVPVVLQGTVGRQQAAMLVGCAGGLLKDTWFRVGTFGIGGFKLTLLGWLLAGVATRLDLGRAVGRLASGAALSLSDDLLDLTLRWLLDQQPRPAPPVALAGKALLTGLLAAAAGRILERVGDLRRERRAA